MVDTVKPTKRKLDAHDAANAMAPKKGYRKLDPTRPMAPNEIAALASAHDIRTPMLKQYEKENPDFHYAFQDPRPQAQVATRARGYEPVLGPDGEPIRAGQDPLYRIPKEEFLRRRSASSALSKAAITSVTEAAREAGVDVEREDVRLA